MISDAEFTRKILQDPETFENKSGFVDAFSTIAPKSVIVLNGKRIEKYNFQFQVANGNVTEKLLQEVSLQNNFVLLLE
jgi:hypothetical protein